MDYTRILENQHLENPSQCLICGRVTAESDAGFVVNSHSCFCRSCFERYSFRTQILAIKYRQSYQEAVHHEERLSRARMAIADRVGYGDEIDFETMYAPREPGPDELYYCECPKCGNRVSFSKNKIIKHLSNMGTIRCMECKTEYMLPYLICEQCCLTLPIDVRSPEQTTCYNCGTTYRHSKGVARTLMF